MNDREDIEVIGQMIQSEYGEPKPSEPGRFKVVTNGEPSFREGVVVCDYCGKQIRHQGISFGELPECAMHPDEPDCMWIHVHYGDSCPALRWRLRRIKTAVTWPVERRWKSWRWNRKAQRDRSDPEKWAHFWSEQEQSESD